MCEILIIYYYLIVPQRVLGSRVTLMPLVLNCLHEQLLQKNELKTCADILGNLLSCLSKVTNVCFQ